jgi:DamX protein
MSEVASAAPSYLTRLALKAMPFNEAVEASLYYNGPHIEQSLNLSLHLASSSDKVALIQADSGVGKTCLLTQFIARSNDNLKVTLIQGQFAPDIKTVLFQCLRDFGVDEYDIRSSEEHLQLLKSRVSQLRQLDVRPVMLIDDADKLNVEVLDQIMSWLNWTNDNVFSLQAVICCKHPIPSLEKIKLRLQSVDLLLLTEQEIEPYLTTRLQQVGYQGEPVFNRKQVNNFFKKSKGNPGLLNKLAHQSLLGVNPSLKSVARPKPKINTKLLFKGIGGSLLVIFVIGLLVFQNQINALFEQPEESQIEIVDAEPELAIVDADPVVSQDQYSRNELVELVSELEVSTAPKQVEIQTTFNGEEWVLQQKGTDYTYQLMGSWEKQELTDFIEQYALEGNVAAFESMRNGRTWHVLIYGVYASKQAAIKANQAWPAPLNAQPSWLRRFDSIKAQIKGDS